MPLESALIYQNEADFTSRFLVPLLRRLGYSVVADLGSPGRFVVKRVVQEIKALAREYAQRLGDPAFLRDIERTMEREGATVKKRLATGAARQELSSV